MTGEQKKAFIKQCEADGWKCLYAGRESEYVAENRDGDAMLWDQGLIPYPRVSFDLLSNLPAKSVRMTLNVGVAIWAGSGERYLYTADESTPDTITLTFDIVDGNLRQVFEERGYHDVDYKVVYHDVEPVNTDEVGPEVMAKHEVRWFMSVGPAFNYLCRHEGSGMSMTRMTGRWAKGMNLAERLEEVSRRISRELTADEASAYMKKNSIPEVPHG